MAIVNWLRLEQSSWKAVAIVGPVGSGKTTLAAQVYDEISGQFDCSVQVSAASSHTADISKALTYILSLVDPGYHNKKTEPPENWLGLTASMHTCLNAKRYIILIDDIWDSKFLSRIFYAFPVNNCGSRILVTTRIMRVADRVANKYGGLVHRMKPLDEIDYKKLFIRHLTTTKDSCDLDRLKLVSNKIHKTYDGKPLAIAAIANTMKQEASSSTLTWVEEFCKLGKAPGQGQIGRFLSIYHDMSHDMRCWLLYLSLFGDYYIDKDRLMCRWVPEGFVTPLWRYDLLTEAEGCFDELIDRNIIQPVKQGKCYPDVGIYKADFLMIQVILQMSPLKNAIKTTSDKIRLIEHNNLLHLSIYSPDLNVDEELGEKDLPLVRSLTILDEAAQSIEFSKFTYLHVLDVQGWAKLDDDIMSKICTVLKRLKYLNIRDTKVSILPQRIKNLSILETLDIRQTRVSFIPPEVSKLQFLQALYVSHLKIRRLPSLIVKLHRLVKLDLRETEITELPDQGSWLRNLLHLLAGCEDSTKSMLKMPRWISRASLLRTLATVDLSECLLETIRSLGDLKELNELAIILSCHHSVKQLYQEALLTSIDKMEKLKYLAIYGEFGCSIEFMCYLTRPPKLEKLILTPRLVSIPQWIKSLDDLVLLKITVCKFETTDLASLAGLRKLCCLELVLEFHLKQEIVIQNEGFKFLERFSVACRVPWLTFKQGAMSQLTALELKSSSLEEREHNDKVTVEESSNPREAAPTVKNDGTGDGNQERANEDGPSLNRYHFNAVLQSFLALDNLRMTMLRRDPVAGSLTSELNMVFMDTNGANGIGRNLEQNHLSEIFSEQTKFRSHEMMQRSFHFQGFMQNGLGEKADATNMPNIEDACVRMSTVSSSDQSEQMQVKPDPVMSGSDERATNTSKVQHQEHAAAPASRRHGEGMVEGRDMEEEGTAITKHRVVGDMPVWGNRLGNVVRRMPNSGNICHFNAVLQSLLVLDELRRKMIELNVQHGTILLELKDLFKKTSAGTNYAEDTLEREAGKVFDEMCSKGPDYKKSEMNDSIDTLNLLLNCLKKEDEGNDSTIVNPTFRFEMSTTVTCKRCKGQSTSPQEGLYLSLDLPAKKHLPECASLPPTDRDQNRDIDITTHKINNINDGVYDIDDPISIEICFDNFVSDELSDYVCQHCNGTDGNTVDQKGSATKQIFITKVSPVLIVQLKRYWQSPEGSPKKLMSGVKFEELLDITKYMEARPSENTKCIYHLVAVIQHTGNSLDAGHYTAYVRANRIAGQEKKILWAHANDANIKECSQEEVLERQAYILFYEQVEGSSFKLIDWMGKYHLKG
uniref:USP domain-containing protein n=1 Tax=Oryza brachyantha TaxID=4533 RepID=J3N9L4_ORYBR